MKHDLEEICEYPFQMPGFKLDKTAGLHVPTRSLSERGFVYVNKRFVLAKISLTDNHPKMMRIDLMISGLDLSSNKEANPIRPRLTCISVKSAGFLPIPRLVNITSDDGLNGYGTVVLPYDRKQPFTTIYLPGSMFPSNVLEEEDGYGVDILRASLNTATPEELDKWKLFGAYWSSPLRKYKAADGWRGLINSAFDNQAK